MKIFYAALAALAFAGCTPATNTPVNTNPTNTSADNTGVNQRDQNPAAKTPIDQNENQRDIQITADIRKAVLATEGMSTNAQNSKIITADGKVTLRGPVDSADEKSKIEAIAVDVAGKGNVMNELDVKE